MIFFENIRLVPADSKHLPYLVRWLNSRPPTRMRVSKKLTNVAEQENRISSLSDETQLLIAHNGAEPYGFAELLHLSGPARITNLRTYADRDGEAKILQAALGYCFYDLGRNKTSAEILSGDAGLLKIYEAAGFKPEVRRRQNYFAEGRYHHVVELALLAKEFVHEGAI